MANVDSKAAEKGDIKGFDVWEQSRLNIVVNILNADGLVDESNQRPFSAERRACRIAFSRGDRTALIASIRALAGCEDPNLKLRAIEMLNALGRDTRVIPVFEGLLSDNNENVYRLSARHLKDIKGKSDSVLELLKNATTDEERTKYIMLVAFFGNSDKESIDAVAGYLNDPNPKLRANSANSIASIGADASVTLPLLIERLGEEERLDVRRSLYLAVGRVGGHDQRAVDLLILDGEARQSPGCIEALGYAKVRIPKAAYSLVKIVPNSKDAYRRELAIRSIGRLAHGSPEVIDILLDTTLDERLGDDIRISSIEALGEVASRNLTSDDALKRAYSRGNLHIRRAIIEVLPDVVSEMVALQFLTETGLRDDEPYVRAAAFNAIALYGESAIKYVPSLEEHLMAEGSLRARVAAISAIQTIHPESDHGKTLTNLLREIDRTENDGDAWTPDDTEVELLIRAIGKFGQRSDELVQSLVALLDDGDELIRLAAINTLQRLGEVSRAHVRKKLREMINDSSWKVSRAAFISDRIHLRRDK